MRVQLHHPVRTMELHGPKRVRDLLGTLKILPDTVLVIRGDELITEDEPLHDDDAIEIRPVISGGGSPHPAPSPRLGRGGEAGAAVHRGGVRGSRRALWLGLKK